MNQEYVNADHKIWVEWNEDEDMIEIKYWAYRKHNLRHLFLFPSTARRLIKELQGETP